MGIFCPQFKDSEEGAEKRKENDDLRLTMLRHGALLLRHGATLGARVTKKRIGQFDLETGEILGNEGFVAYVVPKRQNGFREGWLAMSQDALTVLQQFTRVEDFRVLMALLARLDFENLLVVNQADIARDLNMRREHVNHAIKRLITAGALLEGPRIGVSRSYRLNPKFGWKGSAKGHVIALSDYRREQPTTEQDTPSL